tara:strand:- start:97 stop:378 length:282 start_codon:yes stop_codon:yes gene_type:complete
MTKEINEKKFFIIRKTKYDYQHDNYSVHDDNMYDLTTAVKKLLALDTLNEDRKRVSYHLQEVNFSMVQEPLVLKNEVKEDKNWKECIDESRPF